jgi:hypothetical protein
MLQKYLRVVSMKRTKEYYNYMRSPKWKRKSQFCHRLTRHRCVLLPWRRSEECHHLHYFNFKHEVPWVDIVPLSRLGHSIVHLGVFWHSPLRPVVGCLLRLLMFVTMVLLAIAQLFKLVRFASLLLFARPLKLLSLLD